jgi:hypothetical protein
MVAGVRGPGRDFDCALVGGIGGVVLGGRMNRRTMQAVESARAEREEALDVARAAREERLDAARAKRTLASERRQALGAVRVMANELREAVRAYEQERDDPSETPFVDKQFAPSIQLRPEDRHAIAAWSSDELWGLLSVVLLHINADNIIRESHRDRVRRGVGAFDADAYRQEAGENAKRTQVAITELVGLARTLEAD